MSAKHVPYKCLSKSPRSPVVTWIRPRNCTQENGIESIIKSSLLHLKTHTGIEGFQVGVALINLGQDPAFTFLNASVQSIHVAQQRSVKQESLMATAAWPS
jgi:hypothetical protein